MIALKIMRGEPVQWRGWWVTPVALVAGFRNRAAAWWWHAPLGMVVDDRSGARSAGAFKPVVDVYGLARLAMAGLLLVACAAGMSCSGKRRGSRKESAQ